MTKLLDEQIYLKEMAELLDDADFTDAVDRILELIQKPDIAPSVAQAHIVKLQAIAVKFGLLKTYYMTLGPKSQEAKWKKNIYFNIDEGINRMVDALKYVAKIR